MSDNYQVTGLISVMLFSCTWHVAWEDWLSYLICQKIEKISRRRNDMRFGAEKVSETCDDSLCLDTLRHFIIFVPWSAAETQLTNTTEIEKLCDNNIEVFRC